MDPLIEEEISEPVLEPISLVDEEEVTGVAYGSSAKEGGAAGGKRVGTKALRIPSPTS